MLSLVGYSKMYKYFNKIKCHKLNFSDKINSSNQRWKHTPVMPTFERLSHEDFKFRASPGLGYKVSSGLNNKTE